MDKKLKEIYRVLMGARGYGKGKGKCLGGEVHLEWLAYPTNYASAIWYHGSTIEQKTKTKVIKLF